MRSNDRGFRIALYCFAALGFISIAFFIFISVVLRSFFGVNHDLQKTQLSIERTVDAALTTNDPTLCLSLEEDYCTDSLDCDSWKRPRQECLDQATDQSKNIQDCDLYIQAYGSYDFGIGAKRRCIEKIAINTTNSAYCASLPPHENNAPADREALISCEAAASSNPKRCFDLLPLTEGSTTTRSQLIEYKIGGCLYRTKDLGKPEICELIRSLNSKMEKLDYSRLFYGYRCTPK